MVPRYLADHLPMRYDFGSMSSHLTASQHRDAAAMAGTSMVQEDGAGRMAGSAVGPGWAVRAGVGPLHRVPAS